MSTKGEVNTITTDKPKNPGRQEWGRKLGKMNKDRKLQYQQELEKEQAVEKFSFGSLVRLDYCLVASAIIVGALSVYYRHKCTETPAINPLDSAEAVNPLDSAKTVEIKNTKPQFSAF